MSTLADNVYAFVLAETLRDLDATDAADAEAKAARPARKDPVEGGKPINFLRSLVPAACPACGAQGVTDAGLRPWAKRCPAPACCRAWGIDATVYGFTPELPAEGVVFSLGRNWTLTGTRGEERPEWLVEAPTGDTATVDGALQWEEVLDARGRSTRIPADILERLDRYTATLEPLL